MRAILSRARTALPRSIFSLSPLLLLILLVWPALLLAQDSTVVVQDKTGLFGGLIDHYFGAIVGLIQSGLVWVFTKESPAWKKLAEPLKWGVLYLVGFALTWISLKTGFGGATIEGNTLTTAGVLAAVPTLASGLIFKLGGHKVPPAPAPAAQPFRSHVG